MTFEFKPGPPSWIDTSDGTASDRVIIAFKNGQTIAFKLNEKSTRLICDPTLTTLELIESVGRGVQKLFRPPSRTYELKKPSVSDVQLDMQIQLPQIAYVTEGQPLVVAVVLGEKTFGFTPADGSPVQSIRFSAV